MEADPQTPSKNSRTSVILRALSTLSPPSPILSPSQLPATFTSGDIPILIASCSDDDVWDINDSPASSRFRRARHGSVATFRSGGTFGPSGQMNEEGEGFYCGSHPSPSLEDGTRTGWDGHSNNVHSPEVPAIASVTQACYPSKGASTVIELCSSISTYSSPSRKRPSPSCSLPVLKLEADAVSSPFKPVDDTVGEQYVYPSWQTFSTLPSPLFAPPSPSYSVDQLSSAGSSPKSRRKFKLHSTICTNDGVWQPLCPEVVASRSGPLTPSSSSLTPSNSFLTPSSSFLMVPRCGSEPTSPTTPELADTQHRPLSASSSAANLSTRSTVLVPKVVVTDNKPPRSVPNLPEHLAWLRGTVVTLSIDQEGFRSVQPSFRLIGYNPGSAYSKRSMAEFMPFKRETFVFHHAAFDSAPLLRRVTINHDETRDYISRQASLNLKVNGVYTVHGIESSVLPDGGAGGIAPNLEWVFAYVVSDKRAETSGKVVAGEKMFTPLTFSCTPELVHSRQGKKIRIIRVMKKSVAPKLAAHKLEPPRLGWKVAPPILPSAAKDQGTALPAAADKHRNNANAATTPPRRRLKHKTVGSTESARRPAPQTRVATNQAADDSCFPPVLLASHSQATLRRTSRQGAPSLWESGPFISSVTQAAALDRHILPRAELRRMLSNGVDDGVVKSYVVPPGFQPLRPPPRHRRAS